jgi:hypothetical protein
MVNKFAKKNKGFIMAKLKIKIDLDNLDQRNINYGIFENLSLVIATILNRVETEFQLNKQELFKKVRILTEAMSGLQHMDRSTYEIIAAKQSILNLKKHFENFIKEFYNLINIKLKIKIIGNKNIFNEKLVNELLKVMDVKKVTIESCLNNNE